MRYIPEAQLKSFNNQVWQISRQVPFGKVATYGQIAKMITTPDAISVEEYREFSARWVGDAMSACPSDVPWQRVINAQGKVSKRVEAQRQKTLLEEEGIVFLDDKLDLKHYQWSGSEDEEPNQASLF
jgi:methylated-DNA-protein-cysteine methyltransferase-like protein